MTYNKNRNSLLYLLVSCISVRSAPQTLSVKHECTFRFSNVLIVGFCNSSANCWFVNISLLRADLSAPVTVPPEHF